jgi:hypothetical protein
MTDKTFTFTIEQIKQIYSAGIRRGSDEQSAHDWGCRPNGKEYDECVEAIHDIVNEGFKWGDGAYTSYGEVENWFKEAK